MTASPAEIVRQGLVGLKVVQMPGLKGQTVPFNQTPGDTSTLCFVASMPEEIDQAVCLYDIMGRNFGRSMRGKRWVHPGVKVLVRALTYDVGYTLANTLAIAIEQLNKASGIELSDYVQSVYRTMTIVSLGEEPNRRRQHLTFDVRVAFQDRQTSVG